MSTISYRRHERLQGGQIAGAAAAFGFLALGVFQLSLVFVRRSATPRGVAARRT